MAQLLIKLNKRSRFKANLPLLCFNFGKIRHFYAKCPFREDNDDEEEPRKRVFKGKDSKKKNIYSKEDNYISEQEEYDFDYDRKEIQVLYMNEESNIQKSD